MRARGVLFLALVAIAAIAAANAELLPFKTSQDMQNAIGHIRTKTNAAIAALHPHHLKMQSTLFKLVYSSDAFGHLSNKRAVNVFQRDQIPDNIYSFDQGTGLLLTRIAATKEVQEGGAQDWAQFVLEVVTVFENDYPDCTIDKDFPRFGTILAWMTPIAIDAIAHLDGVARLEAAMKPTTQGLNSREKKTVPNVPGGDPQGYIAHSIQDLVTKYGVTGRGVKIGVISDSVDRLELAQAGGFLPSSVTVLYTVNGTGEGTAMLEIVHALAPEADLYFASAFPTMEAFASSVLALAVAGCDIIVDDVAYSSEPPLHDYSALTAVINEVMSTGVVYVTAASNSANTLTATSQPATQWEGLFLPSLDSPTILQHSNPNADPSLANPADKLFVINVGLDFSGLLTLWWSDPLVGSFSDYNFYLVAWSAQAGGIVLLYSSTNVQNGSSSSIPVENLPVYGSFLLAVMLAYPAYTDWVLTAFVMRADTTVEPRYLHMHCIYSTLQLDPSTPMSSMGHAQLPGVYTIGAVHPAGPLNATIPYITTPPGVLAPAPYSSQGGRRVFYDINQFPTQLPMDMYNGGVIRPVVSFAAAANIETPFFPLEGGTFAGTSAAAPHFAALVGLLLSYDRQRVREAINMNLLTSLLASDTIDFALRGFDSFSGYGIPTLDVALSLLQNCGPSHYIDTGYSRSSAVADFYCIPCGDGRTSVVAGFGFYSTCVPITTTTTPSPSIGATISPEQVNDYFLLILSTVTTEVLALAFIISFFLITFGIISVGVVALILKRIATKRAGDDVQASGNDFELLLTVAANDPDNHDAEDASVKV